jgi:hypothetical protein
MSTKHVSRIGRTVLLREVEVEVLEVEEVEEVEVLEETAWLLLALM